MIGTLLQDRYRLDTGELVEGESLHIRPIHAIRAPAAIQSGLALARHIGEHRLIVWLDALQALVEADLGLDGAAVASAESALARADDLGQKALWGAGRLAEAASRVTEYLALARETKSLHYEGIALPEPQATDRTGWLLSYLSASPGTVYNM